MDGIRAIAAICSWPEERPQVQEPPPAPGWLGDGASALLARELSEQTRLVVELGSWVGLSTRFIADHAPHAVVIAVDHWAGSPEHQRKPTWKAMLPTLYETFLALCWDYRHRVIPLRMTTLEGLRVVAGHGLEPDLIYVDAEHSDVAVTGEIELIRRSFPRAAIIGDDYDWPGIAPAMADAARRHNLVLETAGTAERGRAWKLTASQSKPSSVPEPAPISVIAPLAGPPALGAVPASLALTHTRRAGGSVDCATARAATHEPRYLTFPDLTPEAGLYPIARIIDELGRRRPDIPVLVVDQDGAAGALFTCGIDPTAHKNLQVMHGDGDSRRHWSVTRVALLPWLAPELSPARAVEAIVNGIPVVASDRGAIVEALGRAGLVLPLPHRLTPSSRSLPTAAEMAPWVDLILQLWDDPAFYDEHRRLALAEAERLAAVVEGQARIALPPAPPSERSTYLVLVPFLERIDPACERGLYQLEAAGLRVVRKPGCSAIDLARSELASDALHDGAEAILFIDSDIAFDPADALRILARLEPVVAGVYAKKNQRELACIFAEGIKNVVFGPAAPGLYLLKYASAGFLRVRSAVLRRMVADLRLPLCNTLWGRGFWPFFMPAIVEPKPGVLHYLAEDWAFCHRLRQIGINPMADTSIRLFHVGAHGFGWEDAGSEVYRYRSYTYFL
ncbi:MAG: class I SAM-dependent methyltransferase [Isosphaerales bacterium]